MLFFFPGFIEMKWTDWGWDGVGASWLNGQVPAWRHPQPFTTRQESFTRAMNGRLFSVLKVAAWIPEKHGPAFQCDPRNRCGSQALGKGGRPIREPLSGCLCFQAAAVPETWPALLKGFPGLHSLDAWGRVSPKSTPYWLERRLISMRNRLLSVSPLGKGLGCSEPVSSSMVEEEIMPPGNHRVRTVSWIQQVLHKAELLLSAFFFL